MDRDSPRSPAGGVGRRQFLRATAGVGALSLLPATGARRSDRIDPAMTQGGPTTTRAFEFVYERARPETTIPTLIELDDEAALDAVTEVDAEFRTLTDGAVAAYAELTRQQVDEVRSVDGAATLRYATGSNPFWILGEYPDGVFPSTDDAVDFIGVEQAADGLDLLEHRHPDRLRVRALGPSPGVADALDDAVRSRSVTVAELTAGVRDEAALAERETIAFVCSIHGDERSGAEAALRLIEDVLEDDDETVAPLLDDLALLFLFPNPDGWASRAPWAELRGNPSPYSTFRRATGSGVDPNRQYPTVGYVNPQYHPAEPDGTDLADDGDGTGLVADGVDPSTGAHGGEAALGADPDVGEEYRETVPDSLAVVEALRGYESVSYLFDLHGMYASEAMVKGLVMNGERPPAEAADLTALNEAVDDALTATLGPLLDEHADALERIAENSDAGGASVPERAYEYGTVADTIGYTTSGGLATWASHPTELGGLGATAMAFEMAFDNSFERTREAYPALLDLHVTGFLEVIATAARHAADGGSAQSVDGGGATTAYIEAPSLARRADDLPFGTADAEPEAPATELVERERTVPLDPDGAATTSFDLPADLHSVSVNAAPAGATAADARLYGPDGTLARASAGGAGLAGENWVLPEPAGGEWSLQMSNRRSTVPGAVTVRLTGVVADGRSPDPESALGYRQRPYEVSPLAFFDAYADDLTNGDVASLARDDIRNGGLVDGGDPVADSLVVNHDEGADDAEYASALDDYVAAGGTLVLTDASVGLLGALSVAGADAIAPDDVQEITRPLAAVERESDDHPLLAATRPVQRELWHSPTLGYLVQSPVPLWGVDADAFEAAGGSVAARNGSAATIASLGDGRVQVVGSLLPPATQEYLHPFGLADHAVTTFGLTVLANAVGHEVPWSDA
ncbi:peptidase M14 [Halostella sp. JP-L12]|uniref:M14 family zinc carboxypeptidase n=1 Tax=Halostella TaxID=1843185 RepID=UPI000EF82D35|nr:MULTISPECIES: M14 family zinc carboxypeptidase [Halostella]NHN49732.1 peptidase M14 [Halostella sp. JP-L12]